MRIPKLNRETRRVLMTVAAAFAMAGSAFAAQVGTLRNVPDDWFTSEKGQAILGNIVSWQNDNGGWWKAYDVEKPRPATNAPEKPGEGGPKGDDNDTWHKSSTIDNNATYTELRLLARA